jgi:hypothetical protein
MISNGVVLPSLAPRFETGGVVLPSLAPRFETGCIVLPSLAPWFETGCGVTLIFQVARGTMSRTVFHYSAPIILPNLSGMNLQQNF